MSKECSKESITLCKSMDSVLPVSWKNKFVKLKPLTDALWMSQRLSV